MTIILTIDSVDSLPDGGPLQFSARNRGFEIGRQQHLDWTLPDPSRYISGLHCEVRFEKGGYWLYDVSRNGTFLNGSAARMKSPYRLSDGDRLTIGDYVVRVELPEGRAEAAPEQSAEPPAADFGHDIWDTGGPALPPIDRRDLMPARPEGVRAPDYSNQFIAFPDVRPAPAERPSAPPQADPFAMPPRAKPPPPAPQVTPRPVAPARPDPFAAPVFRAEPIAPAPKAHPFDSDSFLAAPAAIVPPVPAAAQPFPPPRPPAAAPSIEARFIEGLAAGAGVPVETFSGRDPGEIGREVGLFLKVAVEQLSQLLRARAAAKAMTKSASRTMIGATDNNPLKFIPGSAEIIDVMFARRRPGFLGAQASLEAGFADLKRHELATYAAMQKALSRLLEDLSPEAISAKAGSSVLSSKKSRSWELFEERWEQKNGAGENGMLDVFLAYFAEAYDEANRKA